MKAKPSALFDDFAGSIGNVTFSRSRSGLFARTKVYPKTIPVIESNNVQSFFSDNISAWRALTGPAKALWSGKVNQYTFYDRYNQPYHPSGYQLFLTLNMNLYPLSTGGVTIPPNYSVLANPGFAATSLYLSARQLNFSWTASMLSNEWYKIYISEFYNLSVLRANPKFYFLVTIPDYQSQPYNAYTQVLSLLGRTPVAGEAFYISYWRVNVVTGLLSSEQRTLIEVVA